MTISDESIRRLAAKIQARDGVTPEVAMKKAAKWAANQLLKTQPRTLDPVTRIKSGKHGPSVICECERCKDWRAANAETSARRERAYRGAFGGR